MPNSPWFVSSAPVLDQLGATFGGQRMFTAQGANGDAGVDYTDLLQNQIDYQKQMADRDYGLKKQGLDQQYSLAKMQARSQEERNQIDREYQQAQVQLARDRLGQDVQQFNQNLGQRQHEFDVNQGNWQQNFGQHQHEFDIGQGNYQQNFGEDQRRFNVGQGNNERDFGQRQYEFGANLGENQRQYNTTTGYNLLNMQAQLRGPANYFQASNFARGVANDPNSSTFLNALRSNTRLPGFSQQGGVPDPVSLNSLAAQQGNQYAGGAYPVQEGASGAANDGGRPSWVLGQQAAQWDALSPEMQQRYIQGQNAPTAAGGPMPQYTNGAGRYGMLKASDGVSNPEQYGAAPHGPIDQYGKPIAAPSGAQAPSGDDAYLAQIRGIYGAGAHKLGGGSLERMTSTERGLLGSGIDAIGGDTGTFMDMYRRSRVNQGAAGSRAA